MTQLTDRQTPYLAAASPASSISAAAAPTAALRQAAPGAIARFAELASRRATTRTGGSPACAPLTDVPFQPAVDTRRRRAVPDGLRLVFATAAPSTASRRACARCRWRAGRSLAEAIETPRPRRPTRPTWTRRPRLHRPEHRLPRATAPSSTCPHGMVVEQPIELVYLAAASARRPTVVASAAP